MTQLGGLMDDDDELIRGVLCQSSIVTRQRVKSFVMCVKCRLMEMKEKMNTG